MEKLSQTVRNFLGAINIQFLLWVALELSGLSTKKFPESYSSAASPMDLFYSEGFMGSGYILIILTRVSV